MGPSLVGVVGFLTPCFGSFLVSVTGMVAVAVVVTGMAVAVAVAVVVATATARLLAGAAEIVMVVVVVEDTAASAGETSTKRGMPTASRCRGLFV